jgi:hypothetical protein
MFPQLVLYMLMIIRYVKTIMTCYGVLLTGSLQSEPRCAVKEQMVLGASAAFDQRPSEGGRPLTPGQRDRLATLGWQGLNTIPTQ